MKIILIASFFFALEVSASILGGVDDRENISETNAEIQALARSVPALIQKHRLISINKDEYALKGLELITDMKMCPGEKFSKESIVANCSASLIAPNKILTAAHCLYGEDYSCDTYNIVFDYLSNRVLKKNVYSCKEILFFNFNLRLPGIDLAIIELDRNVEDREAVKISYDLKVGDPLQMIGYPLGISQKYVGVGEVETIDSSLHSFKHNLDSFSVNSGGPIFNKNLEQVGVLVRGTGLNLVKNERKNCEEWGVDSPTGFSEGNTLGPVKHLLK